MGCCSVHKEGLVLVLPGRKRGDVEIDGKIETQARWSLPVLLSHRWVPSPSPARLAQSCPVLSVLMEEPFSH